MVQQETSPVELGKYEISPEDFEALRALLPAPVETTVVEFLRHHNIVKSFEAHGIVLLPSRARSGPKVSLNEDVGLEDLLTGQCVLLGAYLSGWGGPLLCSYAWHWAVARNGNETLPFLKEQDGPKYDQWTGYGAFDQLLGLMPSWLKLDSDWRIEDGWIRR